MNSTSGKQEGQSEKDLVAEACQGSAQAFGKLYQKYVDQIYSYVYYRTNHQREAEDLCSRVFLRALRHIENYEDRGYPFSAWLYRIAHNLVVNWYRDRERDQEIPLIDQYPPPSVSANIEGRLEKIDERENLLKMIRGLPEDRQELLILKHVEGLSNREIGQIMDRTEGAIKALYHRTLVSLRDDYQL